MAERARLKRSPRKVPSTRSQKTPATIHQLAASAGVSTASVSRVLNNSAKVSDNVRKRVLKAADRLDYVPNTAARALASQNTLTIGAVVPSLENPGFAIGVEALQNHLAQKGYTLFVASSNYNKEQEYRQVESLVMRGVDGIMLVGSDHSAELYDFLNGRGVPFVETWVHSRKGAPPAIGFDNKAAAVTLTNHLLDLGHKDFAVIGGITKSNDRARARINGIRKALRVHGLALPKECLLERPYRIIDGQGAMREILEAKRRPTAIICGNDSLAFGAMLECQRQNISVPGDISIAGFDDRDFASQLNPPLTTIHVPADEIGAAAADYLLSATEKDTEIPIPQIPVTLKVRASTGKPKRNKRN